MSWISLQKGKWKLFNTNSTMISNANVKYFEYELKKHFVKEGTFLFQKKVNCPICEELEKPRIEFIKKDEMLI